MAPIETQIPVIDLAKLDTDFSRVAKEIKDVAGSWGFLYVKNHGVDQKQIDRMFEISDTFFNKTAPEEKESTPWNSIDNAGYDNRMKRPYLDPKTNTQKPGDPKESFVCRKESSLEHPYPPTLAKVKPEIQSFMREIHDKIAMNILKCLSVAVGLPEDYLGSLHKYDDPSFTTLRLMRYPASEGPVDYETRLPAHTDHDVITLLFQHQIMGLQVRPPHYSGPIADDEIWLDAPIIPGTVLINIGETLSFLSGGVMKSTWHRVVKSPREEDARKERFSMAYFCHATEFTRLKCIEGIKGAEKREAPISCVTGKQVETVRDWIQHRHSYRGYVLETKVHNTNGITV